MAGFCRLVGHGDSGYLRHATRDRMHAPGLKASAPEKCFAGDYARGHWKSQYANGTLGSLVYTEDLRNPTYYPRSSPNIEIRDPDSSIRALRVQSSSRGRRPRGKSTGAQSHARDLDSRSEVIRSWDIATV